MKPRCSSLFANPGFSLIGRIRGVRHTLPLLRNVIVQQAASTEKPHNWMGIAKAVAGDAVALCELIYEHAPKPRLQR
jgi:hypothetical protein